MSVKQGVSVIGEAKSDDFKDGDRDLDNFKEDNNDKHFLLHDKHKIAQKR